MSDLVALREPPHSTEAEQSLLGALLLNNEALDRIQFLEAHHFYRDDNRRIYAAMRLMFERGKPFDVVLLVEHFQALGDLDKVGGTTYIASLATNAPSARNAARYAELVRDKAVMRELATHGTAVAERALSGAEDPMALAEEAEGLFLSIRDTGPLSSDFVHVGQAVGEYLDYIDEHPKGIETGLTHLDALIGGLLPGSLVVIAGRPSMGKTALALQFLENICIKEPGLIFSLEATRRELAGRMVEWHRHRLGRDGAVDKIYSLKFFVDETPSVSPGFIRSRCRRMKRQHGLACIAVDYLQLMTGQGDSREQEVSFISRNLKAIAKEAGVPVIALAQLSREVEKRTDKRPHMSDLRESGAIEQDADLILFPFRPDYYDQKFVGSMAEAEIIVPKNRQNGRTGAVKVSFSRDLGRFGDYAPDLFHTAAA